MPQSGTGVSVEAVDSAYVRGLTCSPFTTSPTGAFMLTITFSGDRPTAIENDGDAQADWPP